MRLFFTFKSALICFTFSILIVLFSNAAGAASQIVQPMSSQDTPEVVLPSVVNAEVQFTAVTMTAQPQPPQPSYIFDPDERTQVSNTQLMPYRAIGLIEFTGTDGNNYICTDMLPRMRPG